LAQPVAVVRVFGTANYPSINGLITFSRNSDGNHDIEFKLTGLAPSSQHGVHIHEKGDLTSTDGTAAGAHFNPFSANHSCPPTLPRHVGDLGYVTTDASGNVMTTITNMTQLEFSGTNSVIGRGFIVHQQVDDCVTANTGNAGLRYAQGVIGSANATTPATSSSTAYTVLVARIDPTTGNTAKGTVHFRQSAADASKIQVLVNITGALPVLKFHGIHVHVYGDWTAPDGTTAGAHLNPTNSPHALPAEATARHSGDLGNVCSDSQGMILENFDIDVNGGSAMTSFIGRAVVLHEATDAGQAFQTTGNSGARIGVGIIGVTDKNPFSASGQRKTTCGSFAFPNAAPTSISFLLFGVLAVVLRLV
jgi:Cu-Zn family superoxide dismutase